MGHLAMFKVAKVARCLRSVQETRPKIRQKRLCNSILELGNSILELGNSILELGNSILDTRTLVNLV